MIFSINKKTIIITSIAATICIAVALGIGLGLGLGLGNLEHGAVTAVSPECAQIGANILKMKGSAADAAIAILFCDGVTTMQCMGLGGGFLATIYTKTTRKVETLIARETAPAAAHQDMFMNVTEVQGAISAAVPGELKGYSELHKRYGKLPWATLVQPSIELARNGFIVTTFFATALKNYEALIRNSTAFRNIFLDPSTGALFKAGDKIKRPKLADTLELIATEGADTLYTSNGKMAALLIDEIHALGGIITVQDLVDYRVRWENPQVTSIFNGDTLYTAPLPGSGSILIFIMNFLDGILPLEKTSAFYHMLVESFKFAYARRTKLGDWHYVPEAAQEERNLANSQYAAEIRSQLLKNSTSQDFLFYGANYSVVDDHGTAHVSVLAPNGDAVSVTSTINTNFGSKILSTSTGVLLNDQMDDFSTPGVTNAYGLEASPANYIAPGKRPLSSMCPTIIIDRNNDVRLIIGSAGGSKITTSVSSTIVRHLMLNEPLEDAMNAKRLHHQLAPMRVDYEAGFDENILTELRHIGHVVAESPPDSGFVAVSAISRNRKGTIVAVTDPRRNGSSVVF